MTRHHILLASIATASFALGACPDAAKRPIGENCTSNAQCESGICAGSVCLDPDADDDVDGLTNGVEAELGSNPIERDTDGDSIPDGEEVNQIDNVDTDGDGDPDIIESATADADGDCITDQYDFQNEVANSDLSPMLAVVCSDVGVCAGQRGVMQVECTGVARCIYGAVAGYQNPETSCDGLDQNCDGVADDGLPDRDADGVADCVDADWDNDTVTDDADNCPTIANGDQADGDDDGIGNECLSSYALSFVTSPSEVTAGTPFSASVALVAVAQDAAPLPTFRGPITLSLDGDAAITGTLTQRAGNDGVASFSDLVVTTAATGLALAASSGDFAVVRSPAFEAVAGVASQFTFDALAASAPAGSVLGFELVARDAHGNVIDDYTGTVTFTSTDPRAALPGAYTFLAGDNGRHEFGGIVLEAAGAQTITATDGDLTSIGAVTIVAGAFDELRIAAAASVVSGADLTFEVSAVDRFGNVLADYAETLDVATTDEGASLPSTIAPNAATPGHYQGTISAGFAGDHILSVSDATTTSTHDYTVVAGAAASIELTAPATIGAAIAFSATVAAYDGFGNAATGFTDSVTLTSADAAATMPAAHTFVAADRGSYAFTGVQLATAGATTLTATAGALSDTTPIDVVAGDAASLEIVAAPATVVAGQAFDITVEFRDVAGNLAADNVRNIIVSGEDMELRNLDATTASVVISNVVLTISSEATTVVVTSPTFGLSDSVEVAVTPGAAAKLTVAGPASAIAGEAFDVTVTARDLYDNVAPDYRGIVRVTTNDPATAPAALVPDDYTFTAGDAGVHTFTAGVTLYTATPLPLRVTVTDLTPIAAPSAFFDVSIGGGSAARLELTGPSTIVAGTPFEVTATVYDANDNIASGYTGTVTFSVTDIMGAPAADLPTTYTFTVADGGRHVFSAAERVTLFGAGDVVVTATDATPLATPVANLAVLVTPAAAASLAVTRTLSPNPIAGAAFEIGVRALDAHGNVATGYRGTVAFTSDDAHLDPVAVIPTSYTFVAGDFGVRLFPGVTLYSAGARTVTVTDQTPIATPASVLAVTVDPAAASRLRFVQQPTAGVAGVALVPAVTVDVADAFDNRATSTAVIDLSVTHNPGRALAIAGQATAVAGTGTFASLALDRPGVGYTLTASTTGLTPSTSAPFNIVWQAPSVTAPIVESSGTCVSVRYNSAHNLARPIDVKVEYDITGDTPDAGWRTATQCGDATTGASNRQGVNGLPVTATPAQYGFKWNALEDLGGFEPRPVSVRVTTTLEGVSTTSAATTYSYDTSWRGSWVPSTHSGTPVSSTVGDVDNDGHPDLVTIEAGSNLVRWARGDGTGRFAASATFDIDVSDLDAGVVVVADTSSRYSGRGLKDIIVSDRNSDRVLILHPSINPDTGLMYLPSYDIIEPACGDVDARVSDIEVVNAPTFAASKILYFACPATRSVVGYAWSSQLWLQANAPIDTTAYGAPRSLASGDFDWSGRADLAIGLETGGVLIYGTPLSVDYQPFIQIANATGVKAITDIAVGDLDRDGFLDIAFIDDDPTLRRVFAVFGAVKRDVADDSIVTQLFASSSIVPIQTTGRPTALEMGDLDRDGWLDLALAFPANDQVAVLRSRTWRQGTALATSVTTGATANGANSLSLADLDHDGYPDLALSRSSVANTARIGAILTSPRPTCDDTLSGPGDAPTYALPIASTIAVDVDGDGYLDLVHALDEYGDNGGAAVAYGRGNGRFASDEAVVFTATAGTASMGVGDLDNDGDNDIAAISDGRVVIFLQGNRYTWAGNLGLMALPNATSDLQVADFDLDRRADLAWIETNSITNASTLHIWLQGANGTFAAAPTTAIALGAYARGLAVADLNQDGTLDFAFTSERAPQVPSLCTLRATAPTSWPAPTDGTCTALTGLFVERLVGFANIDTDPELELVLEVVGGAQIPTVQIRSASASGLYDQVEDDGSGATTPVGYQRCYGGDVAFGMYGTDGTNGLDLAMRCNETPSIKVFARTPGSYEVATRMAFGQNIARGSVAFGDFTGDQRADIVNGSTLYPFGDLPNIFAYSAPSAADNAGMIDLDGNGFPDVAAFEQVDVSVTRQLAGDGGRFQAPVNNDVDSDMSQAVQGLPVFGDFDADGRPDIAGYYYVSGTDRGVTVLTQNGHGGTGFIQQLIDLGPGRGISYIDPVVGDFDGNGFDDLAIAANDPNGQVHIVFVRQTSPGNFMQTSQVAGADNVSSIAAGRLRKPDATDSMALAVAVAGECGQPAVPCVAIVADLNCTGCPTPLQLLPKNEEDYIQAIAIGDLNRDGLDDIAIVQSDRGDSYPTFFLQTVAGDFVEAPLAATPMFKADVRVGGLAIADVNGDGWADLIARTTFYDNDSRFDSVEVLFNQRTPAFSISAVSRFESFGYVARSLFVGDLVRSGQTSIGAAYGDEGQVLFKK